MEKKTKKKSVAKKLIPATSMLLVSATMLASSTYAWFTMSREVSVTGINMTASVPSDLQISLGDGMSASTPALVGTVDDTKHRLTAMTAPGSEDADVDWSNTVAVSDYYDLGKLTPATSKDGSTIYYTKDANGVGKTLHDAATFYDATTSDKFSAAVALKSNGSGTVTDGFINGGAYYVDIPVWFRTSSTTDVELAVKATITVGTNAKGNRDSDTAATRTEDLFKAARVAILPGEATVTTTTNGSNENGSATMSANSATVTLGKGVIYDGTADTTTVTGQTLQSAYYRTKTAGESPSISGIGSYPAIADSGVAGTNAFTMDATGSASTVASWAAVDKLTEATVSAGTYTADSGETVAVVHKTAGTQSYGLPCRYTIRIWIEGEDVNCWNATAAQDFNIQLNFYNKAAESNPNA